MNGGNFVFTIKKPFIRPRTKANIIPNNTAAIIGTPETISFATNKPVKAVMELIERSIPAINIAKNSPTASNIFTELWLSI